MKKLKQEKGSITLFVLVSMLFFVLFLAGMYMLNSSKEQTGISETARIKEIYEKDVNQIDNIYATVSQRHLDDEAQVGDYVIYNSGENGTILCRVLYDASSDYGLQLVTENNITNIEINRAAGSAKSSYNNLIQDLNNSVEVYKNKEFATDIRCVGSNPSSKNKETTTTVTLSESFSSSKTGCKGADTNYATDYTALKNASILITDEIYILASRYESEDASYHYFSNLLISKTGVLQYSPIYLVNTSGVGYGYTANAIFGVRACISMKNNIKILSGDGKTAETAYVLTK